MSTIVINNITKSFGETKALDGFSFESKNNEFVVVVGPSGCGKSTLLSIIAGLEQQTSGSVIINGVDITNYPASERDVSIVFQNYALYPNMTVYENLAFPLSIRKYDKKKIQLRVEEIAQKLEIHEYLKRKPKTLSGGQRQRVAIGRAMIRNPNVFLLDEPLSNLDASLREKMRGELISLHNSIDAVFMYVTHDQIEALSMADRIIILNEGQIQQIGSPNEVYNQPENLFVGQFIGTPKMNIISSTTYNGLFEPNYKCCEGNYCIGIRPENVIVQPFLRGQYGTITFIEMLGKDISLHISYCDESIIACSPASQFQEIFHCGDKVTCKVKIENVLYFDLKTGHRIKER